MSPSHPLSILGYCLVVLAILPANKKLNFRRGSEFPDLDDLCIALVLPILGLVLPALPVGLQQPSLALPSRNCQAVMLNWLPKDPPLCD